MKRQFFFFFGRAVFAAAVFSVLSACDNWNTPVKDQMEFFASVVPANSWTELKNLAEDSDGPAILALTHDIVLTDDDSTIGVTRPLTITAFEGTRTISRGQNDATTFKFAMFEVRDTGDLTLGGFAGKTLILDGGSNDGVTVADALINVNSARLTIRDGAILRNNHRGSGSGGGIHILADDGNAELTIEGGAISGNAASSDGGGVCAQGIGSGKIARMTMTGGTISGNKTTADGGGVYVHAEGGSAELTMTGGTISGNKAGGGAGGGGVYVIGGSSGNIATLIMEGGVISGNMADYSGGGVHVTSGGGGGSRAEMTMKGGFISGNGAVFFGGGVYVHGNSGSAKMAMTGGVISGNNAVNGGGGVHVLSGTSNGTELAMKGGVISGNTASGSDSYGGGVYVQGDAVFKKEPESPATITSGVIYGENEGGNSNTVKDASGNPLPGRGHAVYVDSSPFKKREATAGETVTLNSADNPGSGGWD
jgi:hypothetical protein